MRDLILLALNLNKRVGSFILLLAAITAIAAPAHAEGSKDLITNGGDRPFLDYRDDFTIGIPRKTIIKVYAKAGETIELASSAVGVGNGKIIYRAPGNPANQGCDTTGLIGRILNRTQEINGGFTPCTISVTAATEGVWEVEFVSPVSSNSNNPTALPANANWAASSTWPTSGTPPQNGNLPSVLAWDATVRSASGTAILGRVFTDYLAMSVSSNGREIRSKVYVLTKDGYGYAVNMNGVDPFGFIFFANNRGFTDPSSNAIYRSLQLLAPAADPNPTGIPSDYRIQLPHLPDANGNTTHKIFFNPTGPASDLPASAKTPSGTTWLLVSPAPPPVPSSLTFIGIEGTPGRAGTSPLGGKFSFVAPGGTTGAYTITLDINRDGIFGNGNDRTLIGTAKAGSNEVFWDGLDGNGSAVPASSTAYNARVELYAGEVHFPFIDPENNPSGIIIRRDRDPGTNPTNPYLVYFDDRNSRKTPFDYSLCAAGETIGGALGCYGTAPSVRSALNGIDSNKVNGGIAAGGHYWDGNFGDRRGMDTWAFYPSGVLNTPAQVLIQEADLAVTKTDNLTTIAAGSTLTYTIVVKNNGPSDANNAEFKDTMPPQLTNVTWTCTASSGSSCGAVSGTGSINTTVNLINSGTATYTVTGVVNPSETGVISNTATVLRPKDVNDPTDPTRIGAGNNTATDTTTIAPAATNVVGRKSVRFLSDADSSGSVTVGDVVEYTVTYSNLAPAATSDAINFVINESLPSQLTYVPGSATITATPGNNITLNSSYNGTGAITTLVTGMNSTNSSTLRVGDTVTIKLKATINNANNGNPITNQAIATFRTPTDATNNTIVTDADSAGATSNPPTVGNPFFQIADDGVNTGNGSSTADDDPTSITVAIPAASAPRLRLVKRITALNNTTFIDTIDDPNDPSDDSSLNWTAGYLTGRTGKDITAADRVPVKPGDSLEYTIYFLSDGATAAQNITLCDLIPPNTTFILNTFNGSSPKDSDISTGDFGIQLTIDSTTVYLSNANDAPDRGQFFAPGTSAPCGANGALITTPNGAVTVKLNSIPNATTKGTPNSFGFIRFRAKVN